MIYDVFVSVTTHTKSKRGAVGITSSLHKYPTSLSYQINSENEASFTGLRSGLHEILVNFREKGLNPKEHSLSVYVSEPILIEYAYQRYDYTKESFYESRYIGLEIQFILSIAMQFKSVAIYEADTDSKGDKLKETTLLARRTLLQAVKNLKR